MAVDENVLEQKFDSVSSSQENIQSLSLWLIHHKNYHKKIADVWLKVLTRSTVSHRLTLLYLANDVVQNSKKKGIPYFAEDFESILRRCMNLLMDEKIRANVVRVLNIWSERGVYSQSFIQELKSAVPYSETVSNESSITTRIMAEFKLRDVVEAVAHLKGLESETAAKAEDVKSAKLAALNSEILTHLKDKTLGDHLIKEADEASRFLQEAIHALEREQRHRKNLIESLTKALVYYVVQNNEVDQEFKAFIRIGQNAAKVLTILTAPRSSSSASYLPLPVDAPSPTDSDDGPILPPDPMQEKHTSSLDQRLETILCGMKGPQQNMPDVPGAMLPISSPVSGYQTAAAYDQDSRPGMMTSTTGSNMCASAAGSRMIVQPILPLVSSRLGISQPPQTVHCSIASAFGPSENFESADMDITNSDEEEPYAPAGPRGPNLRVIEPIRSTSEYTAEPRRMPDLTAKHRPRDHPADDGWHRMAERLSPRSQHPSSSAAPANHSQRWISPAGRAKHGEGGRQGNRKTGSFRHH